MRPTSGVRVEGTINKLQIKRSRNEIQRRTDVAKGGGTELLTVADLEKAASKASAVFVGLILLAI